MAVPVGRDAEYTLAFRNRGTADAADVQIIEQLPAGMTFVRASGGGHYDKAQHRVVWDFARLLPGAFDRVTYVARVDRAAGRLQTDTTIRAAQADRAEVDNTATTFLTALPEDVAEREVWSPGTTATDSVNALVRVGQTAVDLLIELAIVGGPVIVVLALVILVVRTVRRCIRSARRTSDQAGD